MKSMRFLLTLLCLLMVMTPAMAQGQQSDNLLTNGSFEQLDEYGDPLNWYSTSYRKEQGYSRLTVTDKIAHSGQYAASIENASMNDARFTCVVSVKPNTLYRLSGYVYVEYMKGIGNGANFAIEDIYAFSEGVFDTENAWKHLEWYGRTGANQTELTLGVRVGGYGGESTGKAYFDDIVLEEVDEVPQEIIPAVWYNINPSSGHSATPDDSAPAKSTFWFIALALLFALLYQICRPLLMKGDTPRATLAFVMIMLAALAARILLGLWVPGYAVDINCFTAWSLRMAENGPAGFYAPDYFCDYPPGYMLLLWPCGLLLKALGAYSAQAGTVALLIVKGLPILCDMLGAILLFSYSKKRIGGIPAVVISSLYAFSPAVLVNGAAWGQADSVLALFMLLCVITAMEQKWWAALPLYTLSILLKPQALLFAPVAGVWLIYMLVKQRGKSKKRAVRDLLIGLGASLAVALAIIVPFSVRQSEPVGWLIALYGETLGSYSYATLNAANLYYLLAANWTGLDEVVHWTLPTITALSAAVLGFLSLGKKWRDEFKFSKRNTQLSLIFLVFAVYQVGLAVLGGSYALYGYGMLALVYALVIICVLHDGTPSRLPFYLALALIGIYVFGVKVHERYLFPGLALLLLAYIRTRDRRMLLLFIGFSITTFINTAIVLENSILLGSSLGHLNDDTLVINVTLAITNLLLAGFGAWIAFHPREEGVQPSAKIDGDGDAFAVPESYERMLLKPQDARLKLTLKDWLIMIVVSVLYGALTFTNLGSTVAPQESWVSSATAETVVFELPENQPFYFMYYAGVSYNSFSISVSDDGVNWSAPFPCEMKEGLCYRWNYALQSDTGEDGNVTYGPNSPVGRLLLSGRYLKLNAEFAGLNLMEIALRTPENDLISISVAAHNGANPDMLEEVKPVENLINEQYTCVGEPGWYTGTYFDEIYHARTAYEHLHGQTPYETTHPPLGKLMMAAGIAIFGMTPFGWRFAGALVGVLMLPALYLLAKQLFKRRDLAAFSMIVFSLDLMHFTQTRIATIDSFPVLFIILSYLCMVRYMQTDVFAFDENDKPRILNRAFWKSLIPLFLCGLFMGLSIASKWIGLYSAIGLAVLFFTAVYRQFRAENYAFSYLAQERTELSANQRLRVETAQDFCLKRILITCGFCVLFFIIIPGVIYYLSYIPYLAPSGPVTLKRIIQAQEGMLSYHSTPGLGMEHPFQSPWWQWPFILKPMWFSQDSFEPAGMASTIMCMGNPWVFYIGAVCMAAVIVALVAKHLKATPQGITLRHGDGNMTLYTLVIAFAAQYLPWVVVPRSMYIYHYFASVPFIILATAWVISLIPSEKQKLAKGIMIGYLAGAAIFFVMFFPYASGWLTNTGWLDAMKWFSKLYY